MNSLHITSLYTNIPIKNSPNLFAIHLRKIKFNSSFSINTLIDICKHITNMTYFKFNNKFYKHKSSLPMGNPFSSVLVGLFLESRSLNYTLLLNVIFLKYIDDILIFLPQNIKFKKIAEKLNNVEPFINFTNEKESYNIIPFFRHPNY